MKKITILFICLLMVVSCCFVGCSTFQIDNGKYYREVVASVDGKDFTRYDLLNAYNNYGYSYYVSQQGLDEDEALEKTLDLLIDRTLMANYAEKDAKYALSKYDINKMYKSILESLDSTYKNYTDAAIEILGYEKSEASDSESESDEKAYLQDDYKYQKRAIINSQGVIEYQIDEDEISYSYALDQDFVDNYASKTENDIITKIYAKFNQNCSAFRFNDSNSEEDLEKSANINEKAYRLFTNYLMSYERNMRDENGKSFSKVNEDLIKRYIARVYNSQLESAYIENLEDYYLEHETLSIELLRQKYVELCESDFATYVNDTNAYYEYLKKIGSENEMIYYTPNTTARFGYFLHVLLPIDENVVKDIQAIGTEGNEHYLASESLINSAKASKVAEQTHKARNEDTGLLGEDEITLSDILTEYSNSVQTLTDFVEFMFKYTSDTATLTADMPYVIGYDGDTNYSGMVEEFTTEAVRLMKENETMTSANNYVLTQYGVHLLYYEGECEAGIDYEDRSNITISNLDTSNPYNLYYKYTNELTEKTYFDLLFDLVYPASQGEVRATSNGYSTYEKNLTNSLRGNNVTIYRTKLENTNV